MTKKTILMKFKPDGTVETDAQGFVGQQCVSKVQEIISSLDPKAELKDRHFKPEFYQNATTANSTAIRR
ncbi:Uncharacterised protein [uncultured archaeon]|nr:Uncharacterised protein [uncultured archaeon]